MASLACVCVYVECCSNNVGKHDEKKNYIKTLFINIITNLHPNHARVYAWTIDRTLISLVATRQSLKKRKVFFKNIIIVNRYISCKHPRQYCHVRVFLMYYPFKRTSRRAQSMCCPRLANAQYKPFKFKIINFTLLILTPIP